MKIPLRYNIGSLWARRTGTVMTVIGIGLTVVDFRHHDGARRTAWNRPLSRPGMTTSWIVIRQGSLNETNSYFGRDLFQVVRFLPGIARGADEESARRRRNCRQHQPHAPRRRELRTHPAGHLRECSGPAPGDWYWWRGGCSGAACAKSLPAARSPCASRT